MTKPIAVTTTNLPDLTLLARGKVRDIYVVDSTSLLFVATDRISAFDVVLENGIPGKGKILTQISIFWFNLLKDTFPNHVITDDISKMPPVVQKYKDILEGRSLLVRKLNVLPVEAIVRGYIVGSAWNEYKQKGTVCDIPLPEGMKECQVFEKPIFTPSTKAEIGGHDENIHPDKMKQIIGEKHAEAITNAALKMYTKASEYARSRGIIIADTKFEFGVDEQGNVIVVDEVLTPDSSRFWPAKDYVVGKTQSSFDKQFVRDYLIANNLKGKPGVTLPDDIIEKTLEKYIEAYRLLTGQEPVL